MVNGHLSSGRCKPSARAVLIAFGAGEAAERRVNLPSPQMTIDRFFFVESHFRLHPKTPARLTTVVADYILVIL